MTATRLATAKPASLRQLACVALCVCSLVLGGCQTVPQVSPPQTAVEDAEAPVADTPSGHAASDVAHVTAIGQQILSDGGSAGDAVVAMSLSLTVALPSRMGLAAGGLCLVHDPATGESETLDMMLRADYEGRLLPVLPRGLLVLHGRSGRLDWPDLLAPALSLSRSQQAEFSPLLKSDLAHEDVPEEMRQRFAATEAGTFGNQESFLALTLLAGASAAPFSGGEPGAEISAALGISQAALIEAAPDWRRTIPVPVGGHGLRFADPGDSFSPAAIGTANLLRNDLWSSLTERIEQDATIAAQISTITGRNDAYIQQPTTSVAAIDTSGGAAGCIFSLGGLFGTGDWLTEWGSPRPGPMDPLSLGGPAVAVDEVSAKARLIATGATGNWPDEQTSDTPTAPANLMWTLLQHLQSEQDANRTNPAGSGHLLVAP
ncbi:MAG: hypothetical protein Alpg2KO_27900 [Alphaproteobacteria bacterium]